MSATATQTAAGYVPGPIVCDDFARERWQPALVIPGSLAASASEDAARVTAGPAAVVETEGEALPDSSRRGSGYEREQEQRRNAAARRKLEARRELELLRRQLSEPWDEIGGV